MDVHDPRQRSFNMSRIKGRDTKPEMSVRSALFRLGFRYRLHVSTLPGKPDIVLKKYRLVIFVNGCFWHSHDCLKGRVRVASRAEFWEKKRHDTKIRDQRNVQLLKALGWNVVELWECELSKACQTKSLDNFLIKATGLLK
jgi:DNA mismatch endonuclease (patch repair protein)